MLNWVLGKKYSRMRRHLHWMPICTRVAQKNNTSDFWMPIDFSFLLSKRDCTLKISRMSKLLSSYGRASDVYIQMYRLNFNHRFQLNHTSSLTFPLEATELKKSSFFRYFFVWRPPYVPMSYIWMWSNDSESQKMHFWVQKTPFKLNFKWL